MGCCPRCVVAASVGDPRVIRGSDDLGAGLVTGVMMACTVLAQLSMRRLLPGLGWRWTLVLGAGLLGLPALGHLATDMLCAIATAASYSVAFAVLALAAGLVGGWWALRG